MAYGQMLMVLLAVILFSTVMMGYYNNLFRWYDIHNREFYRLQGLKVADKVFQQIEFQHLSSGVDFSGLYNNFQNFTSTITIGPADYMINVQSAWCDSVGQTSELPGLFIRFDVRIACIPETQDTVWVGTSNFPLQKFVANMGF